MLQSIYFSARLLAFGVTAFVHAADAPTVLKSKEQADAVPADDDPVAAHGMLV
jgi:hypothetical protein